MQIQGTVAVVTGGASGLGRAAAQALLDRGGKVVILDLPAALDNASFESQPTSLRCVAGDIREPAAVGRAVTAAAELGDFRVVVNCAGIGSGAKTVGRNNVPHPLDDFQRVIDVNLVGTFNVIRLATAFIGGLPLVDGERGVVVNTASVAAFEGQVGQAAYAASKGGISAMTLPIARDLAGIQIRVNTIAPGIFDTPLLASLSEETRTSLAQQVPHPRRLGHPSEYGSLVSHIVENPMLNGETIRLDGAIRMAPR
jgi:NAD(P)-dependent dehydrogenase (short-subunit alcohol dehydrogenase family)